MAEEPAPRRVASDRTGSVPAGSAGRPGDALGGVGSDEARLRMVRALYWLRVLPAAAALAAAPWLPRASHGQRLALVLLVTVVWLPWSTARVWVANRFPGRTATITAICVDLAVLFALQALIPAAVDLALFGQMLLVALYTFLAGRRAGVMITVISLALTLLARALVSPAHRVDPFTIAVYGSALLSLTLLLAVAKEAVDAATRARVSEVSAELARSLDFDVTLAHVARLAVMQLAQWCVVDVFDDGGETHRVFVAHRHPARPDIARRLGQRSPFDPDGPLGAARVVHSGVPVVHPNIGDDLLAEAVVDPEDRLTVRTLGVRSAIIVPLTARGRRFGAITLLSDERVRYEDQDVAAAEDLGGRAALALDNARLFRAQRETAATLQRSLLAPTLPDIPGVEMAAVYRPGGEGIEVGGDFYDCFQVGSREWIVAIGDVCGRGVDAAALTALARHTLRAAAMQTRSPSSAMALLNEAIARDGGERFCTVSLARFSPPRASGLSLSLACAGHPLPMAVSPQGDVRAVGRPGVMLGVFADAPTEDEVLVVEAGESLVFYTDGVIEAHGADGLFGEQRLAEVLRGCGGMSAHGMAQRVVDAVERFQVGPARDDLAVMVFKVLGSTMRREGMRSRVTAPSR